MEQTELQLKDSEISVFGHSSVQTFLRLYRIADKKCLRLADRAVRLALENTKPKDGRH